MARTAPLSAGPPGAPRLEPSTSGVGCIPYYSPGPAAPEAPPPDRTPLDALGARLAALKIECLDRQQRARDGGFAVMARAELVALNADLSEVRRLNAGLFHHVRSRSVDEWPEPVLPANALLAPRDVLPILRQAIDVVATAAAQAERRHG